MRRKARVDDNQRLIVSILRSLGAYVLLTHQLKNCCDCIVTYRGVTFFCEIKDSDKFPKKFWNMSELDKDKYLSSLDVLTGGELKCKDDVEARGGIYAIVYNRDSALEVLKGIRRNKNN